jgi:hypothetical protein
MGRKVAGIIQFEKFSLSIRAIGPGELVISVEGRASCRLKDRKSVRILDCGFPLVFPTLFRSALLLECHLEIGPG